MKAVYSKFITDNTNCSGFKSNKDAEKIFDFLNQDEIIIKMAECADQSKPALAGCVLELEQFYDEMKNPKDEMKNPKIDFNDGFTRTVVGRMVKSILQPFGYRVDGKKDLPKNCKGKYFTSASCYKLDTSCATMRIVKRIEPVAK